MWQGSSSASIIETLLDALISLLRLDFAHVRTKAGEKGETIQFSKSSAPGRGIPAHLIGQLLEGDLNQKRPRVLDIPLGGGTLHLASQPIGINGKWGTIVAASSNSHFPTDEEVLLLRVASNQAAIGLENAELYTVAEELAQEAQQRADFEQQLIGIVSHDLKNPIGAMITLASMLLRLGKVDEQQAQSLSLIVSSGHRAVRLIRDLLDLSQSRTATGIPIQPRRADFHEVARQIIDELQLAFPDRQVVAHLNGDGQGEWDPDRLAQVLTNLGSNALQYSPPGAVVQISSQCDHQYLRLKVHNEGSIDPSVLPTLFEPFHRSKGPARTGNVGLGLYITKCIVTMHRGTLEVASTAENGTTFTVVLPRYASANEPVTADQLPRPSFDDAPSSEA
jgi:signal transduction histidine kinase